jgi:hypothetical protein
MLPTLIGVPPHRTIVTTMYREMDMRFSLEQAEAEMGDQAKQ